MKRLNPNDAKLWSIIRYMTEQVPIVKGDKDGCVISVNNWGCSPQEIEALKNEAVKCVGERLRNVLISDTSVSFCVASEKASPSTAEFISLFNSLYGTDIVVRCRKIEEEFNEYKKAVELAAPAFDDADKMNAVADELSDLNAVVVHSASILGLSQQDLLGMAYDKVKGRQTDPNCKRIKAKL